jgi:hypothetical protein
MERVLLREIEGWFQIYSVALTTAISLLNAPRLVDIEAAVVKLVFVRGRETRCFPKHSNNQQGLEACIEDDKVALLPSKKADPVPLRID